MNERERILDLVKKGVISSEEALVLLENLAKSKVRKPAARPMILLPKLIRNRPKPMINQRRNNKKLIKIRMLH